jgi:hypothetical protein
VWRFRGSPHYLDAQARRLGITQVLSDRARHNPEIYRLGVLLAQVCERYHRARKEGDKPVFYATELAQIKGTLEQCELELQKLHMLAGAADAMLFEAWRAFDLGAPKRPFAVTCEHDKLKIEYHDDDDARPIPHCNGTAPAVESLIESG